MKLGEKLRSLRRGRGQTLNHMCKLSGLSLSFLSQVENGKKIPSRIDSLHKIKDAYEIKINDLYFCDELVDMQIRD